MSRRDAALAVLMGLAHVACAGLLCIACDGYLGIDGLVVERTAPPHGTPNTVLIDSKDAADHDDMQPLADCEVTAEPWTPQTRPKAETARLWTSRSKTDARGRFAVGGTAKPGKYDATLTIDCPGFQELQHTFRHDRLRHTALVILVRDQPRVGE